MQPSSSPTALLSNQEPRIAIIGIFGYAQFVVKSLLRVIDCKKGSLVAATVMDESKDPDACQHLRAQGCAIFSNYRQMLQATKGQLDLCIIPTGIAWHAEMCREALAAGVNVLVEKPLAGSEEDAQSILQSESQSEGKFVAVAFQDMYSPAIQSIKQFLGTLGDIVSIRANGSWPRDQQYYSRNDWAGRFTSNGRAVFDSPLNNAFAHLVNLSLYFAGETALEPAEVVSARGTLLRSLPIETFDSAHAILHTVQGIDIDLAFTHADPASSVPEMEIRMKKGSLRLIYQREATAYSGDGQIIRRWILGNAEQCRQEMFTSLLDTLSGKAPLPCPARFAMGHVKAMAVIHRDIPITDLSAVGNFKSHLIDEERTEGMFHFLKQQQG